MILRYDAYEETLEEQKKKTKDLKNLEKSLQAQSKTQQNQQKILESIWNNMLALSEADASASSKKDEEEEKNNNNKNKNDIHVSKLNLTWQRRSEDENGKSPPITAAETFVLADGKNNKLQKTCLLKR